MHLFTGTVKRYRFHKQNKKQKEPTLLFFFSCFPFIISLLHMPPWIGGGNGWRRDEQEPLKLLLQQERLNAELRSELLFFFFLSVFFLTFIYKCPVTFSSAQSEWRKVFFILLAWLNMSGKIFRNVLFIDCCWQMDTLCLKCLRPWYLPFSPPPSSQHTPWSVQAVLI